MEIFRTGGDIVSGASKISEKLGIPLKNCIFQDINLQDHLLN
jgi:hypothetical protein